MTSIKNAKNVIINAQSVLELQINVHHVLIILIETVIKIANVKMGISIMVLLFVYNVNILVKIVQAWDNVLLVLIIIIENLTVYARQDISKIVNNATNVIISVLVARQLKIIVFYVLIILEILVIIVIVELLTLKIMYLLVYSVHIPVQNVQAKTLALLVLIRQTEMLTALVFQDFMIILSLANNVTISALNVRQILIPVQGVLMKLIEIIIKIVAVKQDFMMMEVVQIVRNVCTHANNVQMKTYVLYV